eukprot:Protomagalhaensia_sp_Gyna_25__2570@NODE_245_length_4207_cov_27_040547_g188_i0_p2_GENE_NODE_245_length_4207_cov_27_040547_g188_i0NODE_245_length_4207_cov_27_040547_g188_i0_p2_ORF_typecomplete_len400_score32_71_NODE_245_length_4207_cov_27_040547_g188_i05391738
MKYHTSLAWEEFLVWGCLIHRFNHQRNHIRCSRLMEVPLTVPALVFGNVMLCNQPMGTLTRDQTLVDSTYVDNDLPLISKDSLLALRRSAWQPKIKTKSPQDCSIIDFSVAYNVAWEIGKRGCLAFQRLPRSNLFFLVRKKYAARFLCMDGTDGMSFLSVYRIRNDQPEPQKCVVFSAVDLMHAQWDPIEGGIRLEFYETKEMLQRRERVRWRLRREQFRAIPWNFFEAMIVCLREMSIWKSVNEELAMMRAQKQKYILETNLKRVKENKKEPSASSPMATPLSPQIVSRSDARNRSTAYAAPRVERLMSAVQRARIESALKREEQLKRAPTLKTARTARFRTDSNATKAADTQIHRLSSQPVIKSSMSSMERLRKDKNRKSSSPAAVIRSSTQSRMLM